MTADTWDQVEPWLRPCGACDAGLTMGCTHPDGDPRIVIAAAWAAVERAREIAAQVEAQNAAALALHWQATSTPDCAECNRHWPCPTARALGVDVEDTP